MNPPDHKTEYELWLDKLSEHQPLWYIDHATEQAKHQALVMLLTGGKRERVLRNLRESAAQRLMLGASAQMAMMAERTAAARLSAKSMPESPLDNPPTHG